MKKIVILCMLILGLFIVGCEQSEEDQMSDQEFFDELEELDDADLEALESDDESALAGEAFRFGSSKYKKYKRSYKARVVPKCSESENGIILTYNNGKTREKNAICLGLTRYREYECGSRRGYKWTNVFCKHGCDKSTAMCKNEPKCTDSDDTKKDELGSRYVKGNSTGVYQGIEGTYEDNCHSDGRLNEYTCREDGKVGLISNSCLQGEVCNDGVCVEDANVTETCILEPTGNYECVEEEGRLYADKEFRNEDCSTTFVRTYPSRTQCGHNKYGQFKGKTLADACSAEKGCCFDEIVNASCDGNVLTNVSRNVCDDVNVESDTLVLDCSTLRADFYTGEGLVCDSSLDFAACTVDCNAGEKAWYCSSGSFLEMECIDAGSQKYWKGGRARENTCPAGATCFDKDNKCS
jgi:hypothetical protein